MQLLTFAQGQPILVKLILSLVIIALAVALVLALWQSPPTPTVVEPTVSSEPARSQDVNFGGGNSGVVIGTYNAASAPARVQPALRDRIQADLENKRALVTSIVEDWVRSNDGIPNTQGQILDKATTYINDQLKLRGQTWTFDRNMRRMLGFPPQEGDTYAVEQDAGSK